MDDLEATLRLKEEYIFFEKNIEFIEKEYGRSTYVAIFRNQIVDFDKNQSELGRKMEKRYPGQVILITNVEHYRRVAQIDSPEITR